MTLVSERGVSVQPNPPLEGRTVTITLRGPGPWYLSRDPSGTVTEITPDAQGQVEMLAPGSGGDFFTVTDTLDPPTGGTFQIASTNPQP